MVNSSALIRIGRVADAHLEFPDDDLLIYGRGALIANPAGVKLLVDHDPDRQIGRVLELSVMDDLVRGERCSWHFARVWGELPAWVRPRTKVSFGFTPHKDGVTRAGSVELVRAAIVNEVSVLSSAKVPADRFAEVLSVRRGAPEISPLVEVAQRNAARRELAARARADVDALPWEAGRDARERHAQSRGLLFRPAIGSVVAVS